MNYNEFNQIKPGMLTEVAAFVARSHIHANKHTLLSLAAGFAGTLPLAEGSGDTYYFVVGITITGSTTIKCFDATDSFVGMLHGVDTDVEGATGYTWNADAADDTVTLNGVATGGVFGDVITFTDLAVGTWLVGGNITQSGGSEATPFSATVS